MYISRRKCEVVLAVAKLTTWHTCQQPYDYDILMLRYCLFMLLGGC